MGRNQIVESQMISAIILAAGESKRMGRVKLTMPLGESTVLEQVISSVLSSMVDEVIVVLGHEQKTIRQTIGDRPVKCIVNKDYKLGMSTSIVSGLNETDDRCKAVIIILGDQPFISSDIIDKLIDGYKTHHKGIVAPTYQGMKGHPIIFDIKYKNKLLSLKGDAGGRQLITENNDDVLYVPVDSESIIKDIDTPDDYRSSVDYDRARGDD
jgi:molybdenum cofactor cytidylyltransferase